MLINRYKSSIPQLVLACFLFLQLAGCISLVHADNSRTAPYFTDVSPAKEKVYIDEGQDQEFKFNASDYDGDPLTYEFLLNGIQVNFGDGGIGKYLFKTALLAAQGHDHSKSPYFLNLNVSDGTNNLTYYWDITVNNTNREPVVKIDSPLDGATYNIGDTIRFNAASTTDQDTDDKLVFTWDFGDGKKLQYKDVNHFFISPGTFAVNLDVSDGTVTRSQSITLTIKAPILKITGPVCDPMTPKDNKPVKLKATIQNTGDVTAKNVKVKFYIDTKTEDKKTGETVIPSISPGQSIVVNGTWVAQEGIHSVIVVLVKDNGYNITGSNEGSQSLSVKAKPAPVQGLSLSSILLTSAMVIGGVLAVILKFALRFWRKGYFNK